MSRKSEKKKSKQQKPKSPTMKTVNQPKPDTKPPEPAPPPVNLCDDCAYEFGSCDGVPKFASEVDPSLKGAETDRVVECPAFLNVDKMPTADEADAPEPAAAETEVASSEDPSREDELIHAKESEDATEEDKAADVAVMDDDLEERRKKLQRFKREEDLGACNSCDGPLKRTAYNRYFDAVRCTNPRCRQYRTVVKTIKAE